MEIERILDDEGREKVGEPYTISYEWSSNEMTSSKNRLNAVKSALPDGATAYKILNFIQLAWYDSAKVEVQYYK